MLDVSCIIHPATPPTWLAEWPSPAQLDRQYSVGQRRMGITLGAKLKEASLEWGDEVIRAKMGGHMCTWSKKPAGWTTRCTCGAPPNACPHAYMSCMLLQKVFMAEGWLAPAPPPPTAANRISPAMAPIPNALRQPSLAGLNRPQASSQRPGASDFFLGSPAVRQEHILEVEVDFKHEQGKATLRFYDRGSGQRELMTLATLHTLGFNAQRNGKLPGWTERDATFLQWIFTYVKQVPWQMRNSQVLKVKREDFGVWQRHWAEDAQRFIERTSQQFLQISDITVPVDLTVELVPEGDYVRFNAAFILPGGTAMPVHDYFARLQANPERDSLKNQLRAYTPPIDWAVLFQHFSDHPPRVKRPLVATSLPELLHGHLDILRGDCVQLKCTNKDKTEIYAGTEGGLFFISVLFDGAPVTLDSAVNEKATIRDNGDKFIVTLPNNDALAAARKQLAAMPFPVNREAKRLTFAQYPANAQALKAFWQTIPLTIRKNCSPQLKPLLDGTDMAANGLNDGKEHAALAPMPVISAVHEGPLAQIDVQWTIGGHKLDSATLSIAIGKGQTAFRSTDGTWLEISPETMHRVMADMAASDAFRENAGASIMARHAPEAIRKLQEQFKVTLSEDTANFLNRLAQEPPLRLPAVSARLQDILRPYQKDGILFLLDRIACGAGVILADDMGLGKTLQILAALDAFREQARTHGDAFRALVICPASVMHVWQQQARQFCPDVSTELINGSPTQRQRLIATSKATLLITHYHLARIDRDALSDRNFDFLVLDEAQAVKNPDAQVTLAVRAIKAEHAIAVTGTPLENSLLDLWSIMSCVNPGFLGSRERFLERYGAGDGPASLKRKLKPLILRRTKKMVARDLPERTEQIITLDMPQEQRELYERELVQGRMEVREKGPGAILGVLTRLREICCHPNLVHRGHNALPSVKLEHLLEQLTTLNACGHSTLIFSQFTSMLDLIAAEMDTNGLPYLTITGATPLARRQQIVQDFTNQDNPLNMLLSLKAAGTGLTLTKADYVFLFDPWWNPAVEQQAIDRAHRIGQANHVFAYKYVTAGTVEEKVLQLLAQKRELFSTVLDNDENGEMTAPARLTIEELKSLLN